MSTFLRRLYGLKISEINYLFSARPYSTGNVTNAIERIPARMKTAKKASEGHGCTLCRAGLQRFGYRDVLLLRQFVTPEGLLLGRRYTGICPKMQKRITKAIRRSRKAGLLPNFQAPASKETNRNSSI